MQDWWKRVFFGSGIIAAAWRRVELTSVRMAHDAPTGAEGLTPTQLGGARALARTRFLALLADVHIPNVTHARLALIACAQTLRGTPHLPTGGIDVLGGTPEPDIWAGMSDSRAAAQTCDALTSDTGAADACEAAVPVGDGVGEACFCPPAKLQRLTTELQQRTGIAGDDRLIELAMQVVLTVRAVRVARSGWLDGESGAGKTHFITALQQAYWRAFDEPLPVVTVDAGTIRPAGWRGTTSADISALLLQASQQHGRDAGLLVFDHADVLLPGGLAFDADAQFDGDYQRKALLDLVAFAAGETQTAYTRTGAPGQAPRSAPACWFVLFLSTTVETPSRAIGRANLLRRGAPERLVDRIEWFGTIAAPPTARVQHTLQAGVEALLRDLTTVTGLQIACEPALPALLAATAARHGTPASAVLEHVRDVVARVALRLVHTGETHAAIGIDDVLPALWAGRTPEAR